MTNQPLLLLLSLLLCVCECVLQKNPYQFCLYSVDLLLTKTVFIELFFCLYRE